MLPIAKTCETPKHEATIDTIIEMKLVERPFLFGPKLPRERVAGPPAGFRRERKGSRLCR